MSRELEDSVILEMRLTVIEMMLTRFMAATLVAGGHSEEAVETWQKNLKETTRNLTFPALDPSLSDVAADEAGEAVDALCRLLRVEIRKMKTASHPHT